MVDDNKLELEKKYAEMIKTRDELAKNLDGAQDKLNEVKALTEGRYKAAKNTAKIEKELYDLHIKHGRVVDKDYIKQKAKQISKNQNRKERLGLTQGDKLWGKEGVKSRVSRVGEMGMHALGAGTGNPLFNLVANKLSGRRKRIEEGRQGVYNEERGERESKKSQNRKQNEDQENIETDTGSSKGTGNSDKGVNITELVAEAKTSNKLLNLIAGTSKEELELTHEYNENVEFGNDLAKEAIEDQELSNTKEEVKENAPEKIEEKRGKKKELKDQTNKTAGMKGLGDLSRLAGGLSKLGPLLMAGGPLTLALGAAAAATYWGFSKSPWAKEHAAGNKKEKEETDKTINRADINLKNIMENTEDGSDERTAGLKSQLAALSDQIKKIKTNDSETGLWGALDRLVMTPEELKRIQELRIKKSEIVTNIHRNEAHAQGKEYIGDIKAYDHRDSANNSEATKERFFNGRVDDLTKTIEAGEEAIKNGSIKSSLGRRNQKEAIDMYKTQRQLAQEGLTSGTIINGVVQHPELAKGEAPKIYEGNKIKEARKLEKELQDSTKLVTPTVIEAPAEEVAKKVVEKLTEKVKAEPTKKPKFNPVELEQRQKEDEILTTKKKAAHEAREEKNAMRDAHGIKSKEYRTASKKMRALDKEYLDTELNTSNRRAARPMYAPQENLGRLNKEEAERENLAIKKKQEPIIIQTPTSGGTITPTQPASQPPVVSTKDDTNFGNILHEGH